MLTWLIVFIVFSVLILIHEAGHLIAAKRAGIAVLVFSLGMGKRLFGVKVGDTDYRVSLVPFGGFCKMAGEDPAEAEGKDCEMNSKPVGYRFWVMAAGSLTNYVFALFLFSAVFMMGVPTLSNRVGSLMQGYPAYESGIRVGDTITDISGCEIRYWEDILRAVKEKSVQGKPLYVTVERAGSMLVYDITPNVATTTNIFGQTLSRPMLGIGPKNEILKVSYGPAMAVFYGGKKLLELSGMTYKTMWLVLTGGMPVKSSLSGPIGIAYFINEAARLGVVPLLVITAHLSMALAIFNLLPFPVLDGGHIIFLGIEKIRRNPVSPRVQEMITNVALVLLVSFALFVSWQDLIRFTPLSETVNKAPANE